MADDATGEATVQDVPERSRYELPTPSGPAIAAYERDGDRLVLSHTVVPSAEEGHGVATRLIAGVFADARERGLGVVPVCPFVSTYLQSHPADRDIVVER